jgi:hypothetical protein
LTTTPPIPRWIRDYRATSYRNIYEFCPKETRLYGTESLYGDWGGTLLLLAKDFAPSSLVEQRRQTGDERPFHHTDWRTEPKGPGAQTNRNLEQLVEPIRCGKLYGSALAGLLRSDGKVSGALSEKKEIGQFVREVLRFTISHMPNLRVVACLGVDAWTWATEALGCGGLLDWSDHREKRKPVVTADGLRLFALAHPSRTPGRKAKVEGDWEALGRELRAGSRIDDCPQFSNSPKGSSRKPVDGITNEV